MAATSSIITGTEYKITFKSAGNEYCSKASCQVREL